MAKELHQYKMEGYTGTRAADGTYIKATRASQVRTFFLETEDTRFYIKRDDIDPLELVLKTYHKDRRKRGVYTMHVCQGRSGTKVTIYETRTPHKQLATDKQGIKIEVRLYKVCAWVDSWFHPIK